MNTSRVTQDGADPIALYEGRRRVFWLKLLVLVLLGGCDFFIVPQHRLIQDFLRLNETAEIADWLTRFENPQAAIPVSFPVLPAGSLPLTDSNSTVSLASMELTTTVLCRKDLCAGSLIGGGERIDGLLDLNWQGSWKSDGTVTSAAGYSRWKNGLRAEWQYSSNPPMFRGSWHDDAPVTVTGTSVTAHAPLAVTATYISLASSTVWNSNGEPAMVYTGEPAFKAEYSSKPQTDTAWLTPVSTVVFASLQRNHWYAPAISSNEQQLIADLPVWDVESFFGLTSTVSLSRTQAHSTMKYPPGEAYFSIVDRAESKNSADGSAIWSVGRTITTYDGRVHELSGILRRDNDQRMQLQLDVHMEGYLANGVLRFQRDPFGSHAAWEGAIQEWDGSVLKLSLWRVQDGIWHLSSSYDFFTTEQYPDEEVELVFHSDGSARGTGFLVRPAAGDESPLGGDSQDRIPVKLAMPQTGARLSARN